MDSTTIKKRRNWLGHINERRLSSKNYNRGKNGRENEKRKTENDVTGLDDEGSYRKLKERAGHRGEWRHWTYEPA